MTIILYIEFYKMFNPIRSGGGEALKAPPQFFCPHALILELHYCALGTFPKKIV